MFECVFVYCMRCMHHKFVIIQLCRSIIISMVIIIGSAHTRCTKTTFSISLSGQNCYKVKLGSQDCNYGENFIQIRSNIEPIYLDPHILFIYVKIVAYTHT